MKLYVYELFCKVTYKAYVSPQIEKCRLYLTTLGGYVRAGLNWVTRDSQAP